MDKGGGDEFNDGSGASCDSFSSGCRDCGSGMSMSDEEMHTPPDVIDVPDAAAIEVLRRGFIRILDARWLLESPPGFVLPRRQDLPEEAFLSLTKAATFFQQHKKIVMVSYGWLTKEHPDPLSFYLPYVQAFLRKHCLRTGHCGVFWDYCALPQLGPNQSEEDDEEDEHFRKCGLRVMHRLYGSRKTMVLQLTQLPLSSPLPGSPGSPCPPSEMAQPRAYLTRGWCLFESTVASMTKAEGHLLDLGLPHVAEHLFSETSPVSQVMDKAAGRKCPPLVPALMRHKLLHLCKFTNGKDGDDVADLYERFFQEAAPTLSNLDFSCFVRQDPEAGWDDESLKLFADALPYFERCRRLYLSGHRFSDVGVDALARALPYLGALEVLDLDDCSEVGEAGLQRLHEVLPELAGIQRLIVPHRLKNTSSGINLERAWHASGREKPIWGAVRSGLSGGGAPHCCG